MLAGKKYGKIVFSNFLIKIENVKITHLFFYFDFSAGEEENWRTELDSAFSGFYQRMPQSLIGKIFGCFWVSHIETIHILCKQRTGWVGGLSSENDDFCLCSVQKSCLHSGWVGQKKSKNLLT